MAGKIRNLEKYATFAEELNSDQDLEDKRRKSKILEEKILEEMRDNKT